MDNNTPPQSVISSEVEITGTIKSSGSIRVDGKLDGELHCTGDAIIGKSAQIKGNIVVTSATIEVAKDQKVISTGPYALVRHPMYASAFLYLVGTPLALGSYWGLLALVFMTSFLDMEASR